MPRWKKPLLCFVSLIIVFFISEAVDLACVEEPDPYDYHISFFQNNLVQSNAYQPFYFTGMKFLYDETEPVDENAVNTREWVSYLGKTVKFRDAEKAMYHLDGATDTALLPSFHGFSRVIPDSLKNNTFLLALAKNKSAIEYYTFIKAAEHYAGSISDPWEIRPADSSGSYKYAMIALKRSVAETDPFTRYRYFYQAQRLLHFSGHIEAASNIYDRYMVNDPNTSHIKGLALSLKAGEERRLGDTIIAAYHFSKVFADYPERRIQAYRSFLRTNASPEDVIKLAKNDHERATIYAITGFNSYTLSLKPLEKVYALDPKSKLIPVLLAREVNKLEDEYLTPQFAHSLPYLPYRIFSDSLKDSVARADAMYMEKLKGFCNKLASEKRYSQPGLGNVSTAYLCWIQNRNDDGFAALQGLNGTQLSNSLEDERQLVTLLLSAQKIKEINSVNQSQVLGGLQWLRTRVSKEYSLPKKKAGEYDYWDLNLLKRYANSERDFYQFVLAPAYLRQHDTVMAALAILKGDQRNFPLRRPDVQPWQFQMLDFWQFYLNSDKLNKIIAWKYQRPADPYLNFLTADLASISDSDLNELLGTLYLREHKYKAAATALAKVVRPKQHLKEYETSYLVDGGTLGDPFVSQLNDYPITYTRGDAPGYNKLMFAKAMAKLEDELKANPANAATICFKMATGLYNTSHYGNAWYMIAYSWSTADFGRESKYAFDADYVKAATAEKYFLKARELSKDAEFRAKCTFMAAKCRQKQIPCSDDARYGFGDDKTYFTKLRHNDYFAELRDKYGKTAFFNTAAQECSYLKDFLATAPKK